MNFFDGITQELPEWVYYCLVGGLLVILYFLMKKEFTTLERLVRVMFVLFVMGMLVFLTTFKKPDPVKTTPSNSTATAATPAKTAVPTPTPAPPVQQTAPPSQPQSRQSGPTSGSRQAGASSSPLDRSTGLKPPPSLFPQKK